MVTDIAITRYRCRETAKSSKFAMLGALGIVCTIALASCGTHATSTTQTRRSTSGSASTDGLAFRGVNWRRIQYPNYSYSTAQKNAILSPTFLTVGDIHLAIVSYYIKNLASVKPGSITIFQGNGNPHPKLLELLVQANYGTKVPVGVSVEVSPSNAQPRPANPFGLRSSAIRVLTPHEIQACVNAPVGTGSIASDRIVSYKFTFRWHQGRYLLARSATSAKAGTSDRASLRC
jgi:hypothetical protein